MPKKPTQNIPARDFFLPYQGQGNINTQPEQPLFDAVNYSSEPVAWLNMKGEVCYANRTMSELAQLNSEQLHNHCFETIVRPLNGDEHIPWPVFRSKVRTDGTYDMEVGLTTGNEKVVPVDLRAVYVPLKDKEFLCLFFIEKEANEDIEQRWNTLMMNLPGAVYRCKNDAHWSMLYVSDGFESLTGIKRDDALNGNVHLADKILPEHRDRVWERVQQAIKSKQPFELMYPIQVGQFEKWIWEKGCLVRSEKDGELILEGFMTDVTSKLKAEQELEDLQRYFDKKLEDRTQQLMRQNEELKSFTATVSHDLQTPLRHLTQFATLLEKKVAGKLDKEEQELLNYIKKGASEASDLTRNLLQHARLNQIGLHPKDIALDELVWHNANRLLELEPKRDIQLRVEKLPVVKVDPKIMSEALTNLLANAIKYTRNRSIATIEVGVKYYNGDRVFYIADNGEGFDPKLNTLIFEPFERAHSHDTFEGTGLGLALVKTAIEKHGGEIWGLGKPGKGSTFFFTLPG